MVPSYIFKMAKWRPVEPDELSLPPPTGAPNEPVPVCFRLTVFRVYEISTRHLSANVRIGVVFYWTDPRMKGFTSPLLPPTLWGPELYFKVRHCPTVKKEERKNFLLSFIFLVFFNSS